jgi:hypothetical protein
VSAKPAAAQFAVEGAEKKLVYIRTCALDFKTARMTYYEYKY